MPSYQETATVPTDAIAVFCSGRSLGSNAGGRMSKQASVGGTAGSAITVSMNSSETNVIYGMFESPASDPGQTSWSAGNWVVRLNVTSANTSGTWTECYICRVNSSGVSQATVGSATGLAISLGTTGVKTATVSGASQTANASDRWVAVIVLSNSATMGIGMGITPDQLIDTPSFGAAVTFTANPVELVQQAVKRASYY